MPRLTPKIHRLPNDQYIRKRFGPCFKRESMKVVLDRVKKTSPMALFKTDPRFQKGTGLDFEHVKSELYPRVFASFTDHVNVEEVKPCELSPASEYFQYVLEAFEIEHALDPKYAMGRAEVVHSILLALLFGGLGTLFHPACGALGASVGLVGFLEKRHGLKVKQKKDFDKGLTVLKAYADRLQNQQIAGNFAPALNRIFINQGYSLIGYEDTLAHETVHYLQGELWGFYDDQERLRSLNWLVEGFANAVVIDWLDQRQEPAIQSYTDYVLRLRLHHLVQEDYADFYYAPDVQAKIKDNMINRGVFLFLAMRQEYGPDFYPRVMNGDFTQLEAGLTDMLKAS